MSMAWPSTSWFQRFQRFALFFWWPALEGIAGTEKLSPNPIEVKKPNEHPPELQSGVPVKKGWCSVPKLQ